MHHLIVLLLCVVVLPFALTRPVSAQAEVDAAYADRDRWLTMAALNTARSGFFSSDRTIRGYMADIWGLPSAV